MAALQPQLGRMRSTVFGQQFGGAKFARAHLARMPLAVSFDVRPVRLQIAKLLFRTQSARIAGRRLRMSCSMERGRKDRKMIKGVVFFLRLCVILTCNASQSQRVT